MDNLHESLQLQEYLFLFCFPTSLHVSAHSAAWHHFTTPPQGRLLLLLISSSPLSLTFILSSPLTSSSQ